VTDRLRQQYEAYPYPARDPKDEAKRLITGSPSHLDEVAHYLFNGRIDARPFRILVAGGGTGDALVMLAQHAAWAGLPTEITYLDLSEASAAIAKARLDARGLSGVRFVHGSLLDVADLAPGPYDYIDCCGVLHHLDDPDAGLAALTAQLAPDGAMGLMVYAPLGRTGVYPLQSALRRLTDAGDPRRQVADAKRLLAGLPETNWLRRNEHLGDHRKSDAGLYDLLLHSRDMPFDVPDLLAWLGRAGLEPAGFPLTALYDPGWLIADPALAKRAKALPRADQWALAEELSGAIATHVVYAAPAGRADGRSASVEDGALVPVPRDLETGDLAKRLKPGQPLPVTLSGVKLRLPLPRLAPAVLARIDGRASLAAIADQLRTLRSDLDAGGAARAVRQTVQPLIDVARLTLRRPPGS
jgi:SAM-dependent methyltransferase